MTEIVSRLTAALSDRYRIERELGQGGMATVYLAHDLKHEREVALKVLRPELGAVLGTERFLAEIKITARLDHPHILTLIDSGASDGLLYYVLPLVRGESLRDKLNRDKQLGLEEALTITRQVASALDYAHRQGVIHRDIKPENILLQEGEAMLADFGIALAVKEAGGNRLTETGLSLGTPQYMSPEQATGDRTLDARSDVYSLGAVLYEMLAGEPPVTGPNAQAMIAKLMTERPTRLRVVRDMVPEGIDSAVARALSKVPADRFPSAAEFATALVAGSRAPEVMGRRRPPIGWIAGAGVLVTALVIWAVAGLGGRRRSLSPFLTSIPAQLTTSGHIRGAIPSPDGSLLAYTEMICEEGRVCRGDLVIRETTGEGVSTIVSQAGHGSAVFGWSPDGRWVAFGDVDLGTGVWSRPYVVSQRGGTPRQLGREAAQVVGFVAPDTVLLTPYDSRRHWLRRVVAATGLAVDSVPLDVGRYVIAFTASPGGTRLLVGHQEQLFANSTTLSVVDRNGRTTDSLRLNNGSDFVWEGRSGAVVLGLNVEGGAGRIFVRRQIDGRGRFLPGADTIRAIADGYANLLGISADGTQLFYLMNRVGEVGYWTATRRDASGAFARGRKIGSSTAGLNAWLSPRGGWIGITTGAGGAPQRLEVERFAGGERHVLEPALTNYRDFAFSPADDSAAVATDAGQGRTALTVYSLPSGNSAPRGGFEGVTVDLEWLSDGRLATAVDSGRVIRVIDRNGTVNDFPVPDSLGAAQSAGRSPTTPELAVVSFAVQGDHLETMVSRLDLASGRFTLIARSGVLGVAFNVWWTTDGWIHTSATGSDGSQRLYRAPVGGGAFEPEPAIGFESNAWVQSLSHDGRRAVVVVRSQSSDLWVLRAEKPK